MTDKQQSEVRATAAALETLDMGGVADLVRRQYAELETLRAKLKVYEDLGGAGSDVQLLRAGYAAARLEIESLRAAQPAGAQQPGAAYAALSDVDSLAQEIRRVDGAHRLGAGALAEALMPFLRASHGQAPAQAAPAAVAGPSWDALHHAWMKIGADVAGLHWGAFTDAVHYAPTTQLSPAAQGDALDAALLDWLNENIFYREMGEWDAKYGHGDGYNMWVLFAPKGVQGSARTIISAARAAQEGGK